MPEDAVSSARSIAGPDDAVLVTGANGFIGSRVVTSLLDRGFRRVRCLVRQQGTPPGLREAIAGREDRATVVQGNLLSRDDCGRIVKDVAVIYHLAAGRGVKSFPDAFLNSVVTTRNLLDAAAGSRSLKRFVGVSSFSVYSNRSIRRGGLLDERCAVEDRPAERGDAYSFAKAHQERVLLAYAANRGVPCVILRPGIVYGPGNKGIHGRIGIAPFGFFLHLGGGNILPLSYVDNCADAVALAGITPGVDGQAFNVVDDDLPTSREFLACYKRNVKDFFSLFVPYPLFYLFCALWERYAAWSEGQLPPVFNRSMCRTYWKGNRYSNEKLKLLLRWTPRVGYAEAMRNYCHYQKRTGGKA